MRAANSPLRIALLSYRGHPHVGGQGVYVHQLSRGLADLGHQVEVFAGPPYPDLDPRVALTAVPSLDLYRPEDPFRRPARDEFRDWIDVAEYTLMCAAAFPEPLTFSLRAARLLSVRRRDFDIVHDNQSLGYGLLQAGRFAPVTATVHHPISVDRRHDLAAADGPARRVSIRRWYSFTRMQARVARRLGSLVTVSESARGDLLDEFGVAPDRVSVVHNGVDPDLFRPLPGVVRSPGRVISVVSADVPMKGLSVLIEALAKLRTERDAHLVIVGRGGLGASTAGLIRRFGLEEHVTVKGGVDALELVGLYAESELAVVPSLYEGFSLPAIEAMSCGLPLVATTGGALPEIVGGNGVNGILVRAGDAGALASAMDRVLADGELRDALGAAGRARVLERFTWSAAAAATVAHYRRAIAEC